jgi:Uma2 family endonuclease
MWTQEILRTVIPAGWHCRNQCSLDTDDSVSEPDVCVVRVEILDHEDRHPSRGDVALVIEVADTSLAGDRLNRRVSARAAIPTYWIINLVDSPLEVFTEPTGQGRDADYGRDEILTRSDRVTLTLPDHAAIQRDVASLVR